jgi:Uma2 family endonuclease
MTTVEEYLSTSYEDGDREFVDGEELERNIGDLEHSDVQAAALTYIYMRYRGVVWVVFSVRVQVARSRIRVPDVTVALGPKPSGRILTAPPFIVIEVLSPEDRADRMQTKIADYLDFGIAHVWVLDPETKSAIAYTREGVTPVFEGSLRTANPIIELPLSELF